MRVGEQVVTHSKIRVILAPKLSDDDEDTGKCGVRHDDTVDDHTRQVEPFRTLRSITQRENELRAYQQNTGVPEQQEDVEADVVAEWIDFGIRQRAGNEVEGEVEVGQREEGEEQLHELVDELDVQQDLARNGMVGSPDLLEV